MSYILKRKKLSITKGTFKPNYTVVGSPTVNNGVVSGFSKSNFLKLPETFNPSGNTWEIQFKFQNKASSATQVMIHSVSTSATGGSADGNTGSYGIVLQIINNNLSLSLSNTTSWNIANGLKGATTLIDGTTYYVKLSYNGTAYNLYLSETGVFDTPEITVNSSNTIQERHIAIGCIGNVSSPFLGSIDLKESYIKIGSDIWWNCKYNEDVYDTISYVAKRKIRRYYKKVYENWTQPVLTANGTIGGNSFAVSATQLNTSQVPYCAMDGKDSTQWYSKNTGYPIPYIFYSPQELDITKLEIRCWCDNGAFKSFEIQNSMDGNSWQTIWSGNSGLPLDYAIHTVTVDLSNIENRRGKYWKINFLTPVNSSSLVADMVDLFITATAKTGVVEVSASDNYDYYEDTVKSYVIGRK